MKLLQRLNKYTIVIIKLLKIQTQKTDTNRQSRILQKRKKKKSAKTMFPAKTTLQTVLNSDKNHLLKYYDRI